MQDYIFSNDNNIIIANNKGYIHDKLIFIDQTYKYERNMTLKTLNLKNNIKKIQLYNEINNFIENYFVEERIDPNCIFCFKESTGKCNTFCCLKEIFSTKRQVDYIFFILNYPNLAYKNSQFFPYLKEFLDYYNNLN
ncbi:hypothetical protein ACTFIR_009723 [Dictyostelium discoideum]